MTPGTQPHKVSKNTIKNEPQPLSIMANGGKIMQIHTRKRDIV